MITRLHPAIDGKPISGSHHTPRDYRAVRDQVAVNAIILNNGHHAKDS